MNELREAEMLVGHRIMSKNEEWCPICQEPIPAGSEVCFEHMMLDGEIFDVWTHPSCEAQPLS